NALTVTRDAYVQACCFHYPPGCCASPEYSQHCVMKAFQWVDKTCEAPLPSFS
ncbi:hypothetical protein STEG23_014261, partial [Scotinomys teguina]